MFWKTMQEQSWDPHTLLQSFVGFKVRAPWAPIELGVAEKEILIKLLRHKIYIFFVLDLAQQA